MKIEIDTSIHSVEDLVFTFNYFYGMILGSEMEGNDHTQTSIIVLSSKICQAIEIEIGQDPKIKKELLKSKKDLEKLFENQKGEFKKQSAQMLKGVEKIVDKETQKDVN